MVAGASGAIWRVLPVGIYGLPSPVLLHLLPSLSQMWCDFSPGAREQTSVYLGQDTHYSPKTSFHQCPAQKTSESLAQFVGAWMAETASSLSPHPP